MMRSHTKVQRGQVSLFVAMVFPVIFVFFAMVINVGLIVHHKINLQNSVDMAAYYGAMKQAEGLNAIAHMNYQIHQSWKLMSFRYRAIGTAGASSQQGGGSTNASSSTASSNLLSGESLGNPVKIVGNTAELSNNPISTMPFPRRVGASNGGGSVDNANAPAYCGYYSPFLKVKENYCNNMTGLSIHLPALNSGIIAGQNANAITAPILSTLRQNLQSIYSQAGNSCQRMALDNWTQLLSIFIAYKHDSANRMHWINIVANSLSGAGSKGTNDFYDIEGNSVLAGVKKTLDNNLTDPNKNGETDFKFYNSLGDSNCGFTSWDENPKWLQTIFTTPRMIWLDPTQCPSGSQDTPFQVSDNTFTTDLNSGFGLPRTNPNGAQQLQTSVTPYLAGGFSDPFYNTQVGVEKNPWCMAYVGVAATTQPKIPFSPFGTVTLKAKAYAKPFGGLIGPWYGAVWNQADKTSDSHSPSLSLGTQMPPRGGGPGNALLDPCNKPVGSNVPDNCFVNYSRFLGDPVGYGNRQSVGDGILSILTLPSLENDASVVEGYSDHWQHLLFQYLGGSGNASNNAGDPLAWDTPNNKESALRSVEIAAIVPDLFDISNYSIDPNFYANYVRRMNPPSEAQSLLNKATRNATPTPRADLGARLNDQSHPNLVGYSIRDQIEEAKKYGLFYGGAQSGSQGIDLSYLLKDDWHQLLTGWISQERDFSKTKTYNLDTNSFGKCQAEVKDLSNGFVPGSCVAGGRVGYSTKIVSEKYLMRSDLSLGGSSTSGAIKNPPPSEFQQY